MLTCLFSTATCGVVINCTELVLAWITWHGQEGARARRQLAAAVGAGGRCSSLQSPRRRVPRKNYIYACLCSRRVLHGAQKSCKKVAIPSAAPRGMSRTGLRLASHASPTLAALRPAHEHARAEHARHARTTRARLASRAHALTWQHTLARQKLGCRARVTGHWLTVSRLAADTSGANALCNALATCAAREAHASSTRCACHPPPTLSYAET